MSIYETSITNPKKQLEFYKDLSEQLQKENKILKENAEHNDKVVDKVNWENMLLKKENKQLKEQLLVTQTNEETFRLEMEDITKTLGLDENTIFDDVKAYVRSLKDNWNKLRKYFNERIEVCDNRLSSPFCNFEKVTKERLIFSQCLEKLEELEQGSDSDENN